MLEIIVTTHEVTSLILPNTVSSLLPSKQKKKKKISAISVRTIGLSPSATGGLQQAEKSRGLPELALEWGLG